MGLPPLGGQRGDGRPHCPGHREEADEHAGDQGDRGPHRALESGRGADRSLLPDSPVGGRAPPVHHIPVFGGQSLGTLAPAARGPADTVLQCQLSGSGNGDQAGAPGSQPPGQRSGPTTSSCPALDSAAPRPAALLVPNAPNDPNTMQPAVPRARQVTRSTILKAKLLNRSSVCYSNCTMLCLLWAHTQCRQDLLPRALFASLEALLRTNKPFSFGISGHSNSCFTAGGPQDNFRWGPT